MEYRWTFTKTDKIRKQKLKISNKPIHMQL